MHEWPQGFIQDFELGGGKQDGSRMIVACEVCACLLGGGAVGACPPGKFLNLHPLRLLLMQSGTKFQATL